MLFHVQASSLSFTVRNVFLQFIVEDAGGGKGLLYYYGREVWRRVGEG